MYRIILPLLMMFSADPLTAAKREIQHIIQVLPAWESDSLAQYEQKELAAVRADILECLTDSKDDELLADFEKLKADAAKLQALDDQLQFSDVI